MTPALYLLRTRDSEKRAILFLILISVFKTKKKKKNRASVVWTNSETYQTSLD